MLQKEGTGNTKVPVCLAGSNMVNMAGKTMNEGEEVKENCREQTALQTK